LVLLGLIIFGPLLLLRTPLWGLAATWLLLLILAFWVLVWGMIIGNIAGTETRALAWVERHLRRWVARFAPDPERLWLQWAREAHDSATARLCLDEAVALGGAEALFQDGLVFMEGGFGSGGHTAAVLRLRKAAERGHAEGAYRLAEALRTGYAGTPEPRLAEAWYQRAAERGCGPAAAWLVHAYTVGVGVAAAPEQAQRWAAVAAKLEPHRPLSRSVLHHDAAPEDVLVRAQSRFMAGLEDAMAKVVSHPWGRRVLGIGAALLALLWVGVVGTFFFAGASGLYFLPLLMLAPPFLMLAWQARQLRREGPRRGRDKLREAAERGEAEACFQLGLKFQKGSPDHPRDAGEAFRWFRLAAEAGHLEAMKAMYQAYLGGHGIVRDPREAARWARAAGLPVEENQLPEDGGR
jgi:hypothetical protein